MNREIELLGAPAVYPGHPVTIAYLIMHEFSNYKEASERTEYGWSKAVGSPNIRGGGGEVRAAMDLLGRVHEGVAVQEAISAGEKRWRDGAAGGYVESVAAGQHQAERIKPMFLQKISSWVTVDRPQKKEDVDAI